MLPGVIVPEPPLNTAVKLELSPDSIVAGLAAKLVIDGGGAVSAEPPEPHPAKLQAPTAAITATTTEPKLRFMIGLATPNKIGSYRTGNSLVDPNMQQLPKRTLLAKSVAEC
jgi:hypothetical protein